MSPHLCAYTYSFIYQHASSSIRNSYSTFSNTWLLVCRLLRSTKVMFFFHRHAHHKDKLGRRLGACHVLVLVGSLILSLCCHDRIDIVNARTQVAKSSVLESASRKSSACCWPMLLSWSTPWKMLFMLSFAWICVRKRKPVEVIGLERGHQHDGGFSS